MINSRGIKDKLTVITGKDSEVYFETDSYFVLMTSDYKYFAFDIDGKLIDSYRSFKVCDEQYIIARNTEDTYFILGYSDLSLIFSSTRYEPIKLKDNYILAYDIKFVGNLHYCLIAPDGEIIKKGLHAKSDIIDRNTFVISELKECDRVDNIDLRVYQAYIWDRVNDRRVTPTYNSLKYVTENVFLAQSESRMWGIVDGRGKVILNYYYNKVRVFGNIVILQRRTKLDIYNALTGVLARTKYMEHTGFHIDNFHFLRAERMFNSDYIQIFDTYNTGFHIDNLHFLRAESMFTGGYIQIFDTYNMKQFSKHQFEDITDHGYYFTIEYKGNEFPVISSNNSPVEYDNNNNPMIHGVPAIKQNFSNLDEVLQSANEGYYIHSF